MAGSSLRGRPVATDAALAGALRSALQAAGFTVERVEAELGSHELRTRPVDLGAHRRRLPTEGSFAVLARLFLLGDAMGLEELGRAVAPVGRRQHRVAAG